MKQKITSIIIGLLVVGGAIASAATQPKKSPILMQKKEPDKKTFTRTQVEEHSKSSSCWTTINKNVYDLSDWIAKHPGGDSAIVSICGKDGSSAFNNQHGGKEKPERILQSYIIGLLK